MSFVRIAARIAAVQALRGATLVGDNVLDSEIGALTAASDGSVRTDEERPFVTVYTDTGRAKINPADRNLTGNGETDFVFEAGITAAMIDRNPETGEAVVYTGIPATDAAFEFHLDFIIRQVADALADPGNEWSDLFRRFSRSIVGTARERTSGNDKGVRLAAHQYTMTAELIDDPVRGELSSNHPLSQFFTMVAGTQDQMMQAQAAMMLQHLSLNEFEYLSIIRRYGLTTREASSMLLTPPDGVVGDIPIVEVGDPSAEPTL